MTSGPWSRLSARPKTWVCLLYVLMTLAGGTLLSLPQAVSPELRFEEGDYFYKRILNGVFTSVSAFTLTGLSVHDVGRDLSTFGQTIVLVLIQLGGWTALVLGGMFAWGAHAVAMGGRGVRRWLASVVFLTLAVEAFVVVQSHHAWSAHSDSSGQAWYAAVFHTVSALCNAGFALSGEGFVGIRGDPDLRTIVLLLIIFGGFGAVFLFELLNGRGVRSNAVWLTLGSTAVLLTLAPPVLYLCESREWRAPEQRLPLEVAELMPPVMGDLPPEERMSAALFQTVSARSAGFHTVGLNADSLSPAGAAWLCVLMFIGGAPGSMAGGISALAVALLVLGIVDRFRRPPPGATDRRRALSPAFRSAVGVALAMFITVFLTWGLLTLTERGARPIEVVFESVSAVSSSGLSMGLTPRLSVAGRVILIVAMLAGRVMNVTLVAALWRSHSQR